MSVLTLHRDVARRSYFEGRLAAPIFFDPAIECWVVTDPRHCEILLQSRRLQMSAYEATYEALEQHSSHRFPNLLMAFRHIPLCQDGDAHRHARRRLAEIISTHRASLREHLPEIVHRRFAPIASGSALDLMSDVIEPLVTELIELITDTRVSGVPAIKNASVVFDRMIGLKKRLQIENDLGVIRTMIRDSVGAGASDEEVGDRLALFVLGHDTLLGTLGESLHQILRRNQGRRLSDIDYPATPIETGVPYVERVVAEPLDVDGIDLAPGARVRLMLQSFQYSDVPSDKARIFGVGIHACLGKQMSLDLWNEITAALAGIDGAAEILDHSMRASDFVFTCPDKLVVQVTK